MNMFEIIAGVLIILFSAAPVQAQVWEGKEKDAMNEYAIKPAATADMEKLIQALSAGKVPHRVARNKDEIVVTIGPDGEYVVRSVSNWLKIKKVNVQIKYEHPAFKDVVMAWMDQCGVDTQEDFYKWHMRLSPGLLKDIQNQWQVDLSSLPVTPIKLGKYVFVLTATNITAQLAEQLKVIPHRTLLKEEFIKSDEFEVKGDDPLDMVVYGWKSEDGSQLFVVTASAPVMTMVALWVIPLGAPVDVNLGKLSVAENVEGEK